MSGNRIAEPNPPAGRVRRRPRTVLRMIIMLLAVGLLLFLVFGFGTFAAS